MSNLGHLASRISAQLGKVQDQAKRLRKKKTLELDGLSAPVEVFWDEGGFPHLYAESADDLYLAQGFVVGRERSFQMEFTRSAVSGRLAELLGPRPAPWESLTVHLKGRSLAEADLFLRTLGLRRGAERSLAIASPKARRALERYASGVTQAFASMGRRLPTEFQLLRHTPGPWLPVDSISVIKGMAFELSLAWRAVLLFDAIARQCGDDVQRMRALFPRWPDYAKPPAQWNALRDDTAATVALEEAYRRFTASGGAHAGSNAWVVSGAHTKTGKPILSGDPHLMMTAPAPHMGMHLSCPEFESAGSAIPGIPGISLGHNRHLAWTMTASCASDADVFVEEIDLAARTYKVDDRDVPLESRVEEIKVKGGESIRGEIFETRHGPLVHTLTRPLSGHHAPGLGHALCWIGQQATTDIDCLIDLQTAHDWPSFRSALSKLGSPQLNFLYADTEGHIGWQMAGGFPVRRDGSDGLLPSSGKDDRAGWVRMLSLDELPHLYDPPNGMIVSANTKPVDDSYPHVLGHTFEPYFRYRRIHDLLHERRALHPLGVEDMAIIQNDGRSLWAEKVFERFLLPALEKLEFDTPELQEMKRILMAWDGRPDKDSAGAAIFYATMDHVGQLILRRHFGSEDLLIAYLELLNISVMPLERIFEEDDPPLLKGLNLGLIVKEALLKARAELVDAMGSDPVHWRWGAIHQLWHRHRMHDVKALRALVSIGPFEVGGDGFSVNNAHFLRSQPYEMVLGPGIRMIYDLAQWDDSKLILSTGNSGNLLSPRYRDHAALWADGRYHPLRFSRAMARTGREETLGPRGVR
ncbi:MAG: penicillin acylase family protein [Myxococcota bacterium]